MIVERDFKLGQEHFSFMASRKLSHAERHSQLMQAARAIIRQQGADTLSLGRLAEAAGVSKPIAYEHFGSRSGLLIELYREADARQIDQLTAALAGAPGTLEAIARVVAEGYMACCEANGVEGQAISSALRGDAEMDRVQQELVDRFIDVLMAALGPVTSLGDQALRLRCLAYNGAAEAVARAYLQARVEREAAVDVLAEILVRILSA